MNLQELIQVLESAIELGDSDEEWTAGDFTIHAGKWARAMCNFKGSAQAITIRHNTASQVLSELKAQRARADQAEARLTTARSIINDLQLHMGLSDSATEAFDQATEFLTEPTKDPTP